MGRWIAFLERHLNRGTRRMLKGAFTALVSIFLTYFLTRAVLWEVELISFSLWGVSISLHSILEVLIVFFCLAGCTLRREVKMVFEAVDRGLDEGRRQVARIVGRDTQELSAQEVRTAALETLAENLSDGVVAPLFWYALLGAPGMLTYKMINTLDSMIGYHSPRYKEFGCWAARIDDVANYIPARLTSLLIVVCGWLHALAMRLFGRHAKPDESAGTSRRLKLSYLLRFTCQYGPRHASPNSGWPEAALAGVLDCQFGGSHNYFGEVFYKPHIGENPRQLTTADMRTSLRVCFAAECLFVFSLLACFTLFF